VEQLANAITFYVFFVESKLGKTGLTVTCDIWELTQAGGATEIVTGGSASEIGDGLYKYVLSSGSVDAIGEYIAVFKTATTTVDAQHIPALWIVGRGGNENLDAAISSRNATTPPAANAIADQVWDEAITGHAVAGSTGALLSAAGAAADPLLNAVPGSYASGTAGAALGRIGSAEVTVVSPVTADGTAIMLIYGDDYYNADGRALTFTGTNWPTLTGGTVTLRIQTAAGVVAITGTVTGAAACRFDVTKAQVESLGEGIFDYDLEAALVTSAHIATLAQGKLSIVQDVR
jgi:hypothetical protein